LGFNAIALATTFVPLGAFLLVSELRRVAPTARLRPSLMKVVKAVWLPGVGLALTSAGFGTMTAFVALLFAARGWTVWPAFTTFAAAFIAARMVLGHIADRKGGAKVALIFLLMEAVGQALLWLAPSPAIALIGAGLTGFGYSLVYPGFGVEAVRRAPAESRGLAMGAYTAFLDVALAGASPLLGLVAAASDIGTVFLVGALSVVCAAPIALRLMK
jgi:MFS family permease